MADQLSHLDKDGKPTMVNVGSKQVTERVAVARSILYCPDVVMNTLSEGEIRTKKGPVFQTAIIAGVMAVKKTSDLIPLCHPLPISGCDIEITTRLPDEIVIKCRVEVTGKTGVEMEALTGATIASLTIYDMCKALTHEMRIKDVRLIHKSGGKKNVNYPG